MAKKGRPRKVRFFCTQTRWCKFREGFGVEVELAEGQQRAFEFSGSAGYKRKSPLFCCGKIWAAMRLGDF